jgi:uncharacterized protein (TIGR00290 family)
VIVSVFAYGFDESWLGRKLDKNVVQDLLKLDEKYHVNPCGEGGEFESFVLDAPFFKKKIEIMHARKEVQKDNTGVLEIQELRLMEK